MKKTMILFLALAIFATTVSALNEISFDLSDKYFYDNDVVKNLIGLFTDVDEDDVVCKLGEKWDEVFESDDYYSGTEHQIRAYEIEKYNTSISYDTAYNRNIEVKIGKEAFDHLNPDVKKYIESVYTIPLAIETLEDVEWDEYKVGIQDYLLDMNSYFESNEYILLHGYEDGDGLIYDNRVIFVDGEYCMTPIADTLCTRAIFMTQPNQLRIAQEYLEFMALNHPEAMDGFESYDISLNYTPKDGVEEGDYMNYTLDSIEFDLLYYYEEQAPGTGFVTYAYVAVAVVAAAGAVALAKRRKAI